jgi:AcrR family transcriptional regulator
MELSKRQIEIIEAATILIGEKGIQNLTTKNLAAQMGFSEPALYRHFKGKTEILKCVLIYYKEKMGEGLRKVFQSDLSGLEKVKGMIDFQFGHFSKYPAVVMVIFAETSFQYDSILSKVVSEIMVQKRTVVGKMILSGQEDGTIRNDIEANQLATVVMGSMRFTLLGWRLSDFSSDLIKEGNKLWGTIELLMRK